MKTGPTIARGKSKQDYPTPWEFIRACERKFGPITFDLAATPENTKAKRFYTKEQDSLIQPWHENEGLQFLNPEFDRIAPWAAKCADESRRGAQVAFLTPASIGSNWFRDYVWPWADVYAVNGRIIFEGMTTPYPKDCILSVFGRDTGRSFNVWTWPDDVEDPMFQ